MTARGAPTAMMPIRARASTQALSAITGSPLGRWEMRNVKWETGRAYPFPISPCPIPPSPVHLAEDDVDGAQDDDGIGHVVAHHHVAKGRQVGEGRGADLQAVRLVAPP